jgi:hypothetical protein
VTFAVQEGSSSSSVADLLRRIEALEAAGRAMGERLAQTQQELAHLKAVQDTDPAHLLGPVSEQIRNNRLALAILQLRLATQTHLPFEQELALVRQLGRGEVSLSTDLDTLSPHAATGVATVAELRDSFGIILLPKLQPLLEESNQSWTDWTLSWLSTVIAPFTQQSPKPNPRQQLVLSATDRLTEDDLHGAVEQITQLDGPAATLVARWLKEANARLSVDAAHDTLSGVVRVLLGSTS